MDVNKVDGAMIPVNTTNPSSSRELISGDSNLETANKGKCEIAECKNDWKVICD